MKATQLPSIRELSGCSTEHEAFLYALTAGHQGTICGLHGYGVETAFQRLKDMKNGLPQHINKR